MNQHDWYKHFFKGMALDMWSQALPQAFTDNEVSFIQKQMALPANAKVLDVPAGFGRHSLALAGKGYDVTAIDIAEDYVNEIKRSALQANLNITAQHADILEYPLSGSFDGAICMGNSFGYFPYENMLKFCGKISSVLKSGSKFVINSGIVAETILPNMLSGNRWMEVGDLLYLREHTYIPAESIMKSTMKFIRGEKTETSIGYYYIFTLAEIARMLVSVGFGAIRLFGNTDGAAFKFGDQQVYIVTTKV